MTGSSDMTLFEVDEAANRIRDEVDPEANIIVGSTFDSDLTGSIRVSVVATGIDVSEFSKPRNQVTKELQISEKSNLQDYFTQNISTENEINREEASIDQEAMLQENRELDTIKSNQSSIVQDVDESQYSNENHESEIEREPQPPQTSSDIDIPPRKPNSDTAVSGGGLNNLIRRMTGLGDKREQESHTADQVKTEEEKENLETDREDESKLEIPAFLRLSLIHISEPTRP